MKRQTKQTKQTKPKRMKLDGDRYRSDNRLRFDPRWVAFGAYVRELIDHRGLTRAKFVDLLTAGGYPINADMLNKIIIGQVKPPEALVTGLRKDTRSAKETKATSWPTILGMKSAEAFAFEQRLWIARSPERLAKMIESMQKQIERIGKKRTNK